MNTSRLKPWRTPALLILISLVPFAATFNRLIWLASPDAAPDPAADRFAAAPMALILHIAFGSLFLVLAAFQFSPELRARARRWHRYAGRVGAVFGLIASVTGLWLILGFPMGPLATITANAVRLFFAVGLGASILLAIHAARRRDFSRHRAWMIRAFAIGVAGSTQALLLGGWVIVTGALTPDVATVLLTLGFTINVAFAEWRIRAGAEAPTSVHARGLI